MAEHACWCQLKIQTARLIADTHLTFPINGQKCQLMFIYCQNFAKIFQHLRNSSISWYEIWIAHPASRREHPGTAICQATSVANINQHSPLVNFSKSRSRSFLRESPMDQFKKGRHSLSVYLSYMSCKGRTSFPALKSSSKLFFVCLPGLPFKVLLRMHDNPAWHWGYNTGATGPGQQNPIPRIPPSKGAGIDQTT